MNDDAPSGSPESTESQGSRGQRISNLIDRYQRPLLAFARRCLSGDAESAQDAVQETFLRLCRQDLTQIRGREAAWLFKVCRSRVIDMQRIKKPTNNDEAAMAMIDQAPGPQGVAESEDQRSFIMHLIDGLSPRQQEVLRLRLQGGLSYDEIADVTGLQRSNVGFHLHQAVRSLRESLKGAESR